MNKYRLNMCIEDEVIAKDTYDAFCQFRDRTREGFYGPIQADVEFIEEVTESSFPASSD